MKIRNKIYRIVQTITIDVFEDAKSIGFLGKTENFSYTSFVAIMWKKKLLSDMKDIFLQFFLKYKNECSICEKKICIFSIYQIDKKIMNANVSKY